LSLRLSGAMLSVVESPASIKGQLRRIANC
jgi:hypothetical protein